MIDIYGNKLGRKHAKKLLPIDLLGELYEKQNGQELDENQRSYALEQIEKIWGDEE